MKRWRMDLVMVALSVVLLAAAPVRIAAQDDDLFEEDGAMDGDGAAAEAPEEGEEDDGDGFEESPAGGLDGDDNAPETSDGDSDMALSFGLKIGGGGNLLTTPDNPPAFTSPFDDGAGGYAFTVGPFAELRILDGLLGFQTGLIFDFVTNLSNIDRNGFDETWGWSSMDLRIPLLVQIGTPGEGTRLYAQTGPELVIGLSADRTSDTPATPVLIMNTVTRPNWLFGLGLASPLGPVRLSFDIQFAMNLAIDPAYADRVDFGLAVPPTIATDAQHNMDLRLLIGAAYNLPLGG